MKGFRSIAAAACLLAGCAAWLPAANRYVRAGATGAATGTDWFNAWPQLPSSLERGNTYFVADGTYGGLILNDPESGDLLITIRKATVANHGTNVGWQASYGDGQAVFSGWSWITRDNYLIDGQTRAPDWSSGYGIRLVSPTDDMTVRLDDPNLQGRPDAGSNNITFRYVEFDGSGFLTDDALYSLGPNRRITIQFCYFHDYGRTHILSRSWSEVLAEYNLFARNRSSAEVHGESWSDQDTDDLIYRYNITRDCEGTAIIFTRGESAARWSIYGNIFWWSPSYDEEGISGIVFTDVLLQDWNIHNNTVYRAPGIYSGFVLLNPDNLNVRAYNNLWWDCENANNGWGDFDYNLYFNTRQDYLGANDVVWSGGELFLNPSEGDLDLLRATPPGFSLPLPFNQDLKGRTRGADGIWDRGAMEWGPAGSQQPGPSMPRNLRVLN